MSLIPTLRRLAAIGALVALTGCGTLLRDPVPPALAASATIPGMPDVRAWAGQPSPAMQSDLEMSFAQESRLDFPVGADGVIHHAHLALSGGGANGAFGAGFLNGWSSTGKRPVFKIVTGVSTGALIAPFAFLGAAYDSALKEFYTTSRSRDIFAQASLFGMISQLFFGEALADTRPLASLIAQHVDAEFVRQVAQAHASGRRLYIGTADLDSMRFVVWNMGLIARGGTPEALALFRRVMLASASIPIAFPPVFFDVEAGGQKYDEMHVDGGVGAFVFFSGGLFSTTAARAQAASGPVREDIYIIHNGQLAPVASPTPRTVRGIAKRVLDTSGRTAIIGDLFRIYVVARDEGAGYRWITIPEGFDLRGDEMFDPVLMSALYGFGYRQAHAGGNWRTRPPGLQGEAPP
jgi:hypothetical protein